MSNRGRNTAPSLLRASSSSSRLGNNRTSRSRERGCRTKIIVEDLNDDSDSEGNYNHNKTHNEEDDGADDSVFCDDSDSVVLSDDDNDTNKRKKKKSYSPSSPRSPTPMRCMSFPSTSRIIVVTKEKRKGRKQVKFSNPLVAKQVWIQSGRRIICSG